MGADRSGGALRTLRIYGVLMWAAWRSQTQYRTSLVLGVLGGVLYQGLGLAFIWIVVGRFGAIGGWSLGEVAFLYGLRLTAHAAWLLPFSQVFGMDGLVRDSTFDRFLVRPINPFVQLVTSHFSLQVVGDVIGGLAILVVASRQVDVDWSPVSVVYLVVAVLGGALVEAAAQLALSTLAFRMLSVRALRMVIDQLFNTFGGYPLKIFPNLLKFALTFCVPLAFVAYFPASVLLGRDGELAVPAWLAAGSPVIGGLLFVAAYRFWSHQIRHYTSAGH